MKHENSRAADPRSAADFGEKSLTEGPDGETCVAKVAGGVDAPRGERGEFRKVSITLPPETYEQLVNESARRKIAKEHNHLLSDVIREALLQYLSGRTAHRR